MTSTRFLKVSVTVTGVGLLGLLAGMVLFPDSNLLGGFGLVFGPVYWVGTVMLVIASVIWAVAAVRRRVSRTDKPDEPDG